MDSAKPQNRYRDSFAKIFKHLPGAALLFALIPLLVFGYLGWFYYGAKHLDTALYALKKENITVTPQPDWISKTNVLEEVFRNARLDSISLLEPGANAAIAQAFEAHEWVKFVSRVSKSAGGRVDVHAVYRRPVAMVFYREQPEPGQANEPEKGVFAIDDEGIILPRQDFASDQIMNYFIIYARDARPAGDTGMAFGDERIKAALALCNFLERDRDALGLQDIVVEQRSSSKGANPWILRIVTKDNRDIIWGHAPNAESVDEPQASEKRRRLIGWLNQATARSGAPSIDLTRYATGRPISTGTDAKL